MGTYCYVDVEHKVGEDWVRFDIRSASPVYDVFGQEYTSYAVLAGLRDYDNVGQRLGELEMGEFTVTERIRDKAEDYDAAVYCTTLDIMRSFDWEQIITYKRNGITYSESVRQYAKGLYNFYQWLLSVSDGRETRILYWFT